MRRGPFLCAAKPPQIDVCCRSRGPLTHVSYPKPGPSRPRLRRHFNSAAALLGETANHPGLSFGNPADAFLHNRALLRAKRRPGRTEAELDARRQAIPGQKIWSRKLAIQIGFCDTHDAPAFATLWIPMPSPRRCGRGQRERRWGLSRFLVLVGHGGLTQHNEPPVNPGVFI